MGYFRISFYLNGKSKDDIYFANNAQDAVNYCRRDWSYMGDLKIYQVHKDAGTSWKVTDAWD